MPPFAWPPMACIRIHLYCTWRFPRDVRVIFNTVQESIFYGILEGLSLRRVDAPPTNIFPRMSNQSMRKLYSRSSFRFTEKGSATDCLGEPLSISAADRYRNNHRELLQHAYFSLNVSQFPRSVVIHSDGLLFTEGIAANRHSSSFAIIPCA